MATNTAINTTLVPTRPAFYFAEEHLPAMVEEARTWLEHPQKVSDATLAALLNGISLQAPPERSGTEAVGRGEDLALRFHVPRASFPETTPPCLQKVLLCSQRRVASPLPPHSGCRRAEQEATFHTWQVGWTNLLLEDASTFDNWLECEPFCVDPGALDIAPTRDGEWHLQVDPDQELRGIAEAWREEAGLNPSEISWEVLPDPAPGQPPPHSKPWAGRTPPGPAAQGWGPWHARRWGRGSRSLHSGRPWSSSRRHYGPGAPAGC